MSPLVLHQDPGLVLRIRALVATISMSSSNNIIFFIIIDIVIAYLDRVMDILVVAVLIGRRKVASGTVSVHEVETTGANSSLNAHKGLHAAHGHLGLLSDIVSPH